MSNDIIDKKFLTRAKEIAKNSTCRQKHVGAVIVMNTKEISHGYNGVPSGVKHCNEMEDYGGLSHREWAYLNEIHAEENAIAYCARTHHSTEGATIYITTSPCFRCAKLIIASGIKRVVVGSIHSGSLCDWKERFYNQGIEVTEILDYL